jgi:hypothetical protein
MLNETWLVEEGTLCSGVGEELVEDEDSYSMIDGMILS